MSKNRFANLSKKERTAQDDFIKGAALKSNKQIKRERVYKQCMFSLNDAVSEDIDNLTTVLPRVSRSDIVKAGILALKTMKQSDAKEMILKAKE
jgi:hypothetical protein